VETSLVLTTVSMMAQGDESPMNLNLFSAVASATSRFYSPECLEDEFSELRIDGVLRSSLDARACGNVGPSMNRNSREDYACPLAIQADPGLL
jgi:hypothetical protein